MHIPPETAEFEYYDKGRNARLAGVRREDCPITNPAMAHYRWHWQFGWDEAIWDAEVDGIDIPDTAILN